MMEARMDISRDVTATASLAGWLDALAAAAPDAPLMRHKRAGIWREWSRSAFRDLAAAQAGALAARGIGPGDRLIVIGENRPELYAAVIAAQSLGADVAPVGPEFLRRFGPPVGDWTLALAETETAAQLWPGQAALIDALEPGAPRAPRTARAGALILHGPGRDGPPEPLRFTTEALRAEAAKLAPDAAVQDGLIAFLPVSSVEDAALSLALPLATGASVACVEGPATFPIDLHEAAPTLLAAPARAWELIDRDVTARLAAGGPLSRAAGRSGLRLAFGRPLLNALGLSRCRFALVTGDPIAPAALARLRDYGLPLAAPEPASDPEGDLARREAALRDAPIVDRARLSATEAEIAAEPVAAARLLDAGGPEALHAAVAAAATAAGVATFRILPGGFALRELTLTGAPRRVPPDSAAVPLAARGGARLRAAPSAEVLMEAQNVTVAFGGVVALNDVSMQVRRGEILSIIGPNGAGKTSFLNTLNGVYTPKSGSIVFEGRTRARMRPGETARSGIGRTFQHVALFPGLSVVENVVSGRAGRMQASFLSRALRLPSAVAEESAEREAAERLLDFLDLAHLRHAEVGALPYGVKKRVELARALAAEPRILLLDEPMAGMTHEEKQEMCRFIRAANEGLGATVVLIEHDIGVVMGLSDRVVVLNYGRKIADGTPAAVREDPEVIRAYLGTGADAPRMGA